MWAHGEDHEITHPHEKAIRVMGESAATCLRGELGLHRVTGESGTWDFLVREPTDAAPDDEAVVVREISDEPPTVWDPRTGVEVAGGLSALAAGLRGLMVGWMSLQVR